MVSTHRFAPTPDSTGAEPSGLATEASRRQAWARKETDRLIRAGVVRPRPAACEWCGAEPAPDPCGNPGGRIQCHHHDYSDPTLISWLCGRCHRWADRVRRLVEAELLEAAS